MKLPLWQFGKARPEDGGLRNAYTVLGAATEFSPQHVEILRRVSEDAAWRPKGRAECATVAACWPLPDGDWLLFRFLDDGLDDHHRPNTMRIEAALATGLPWDDVWKALQPSAWPEPTRDGETSITLSPVDTPGEMPEQPTIPMTFGTTGELVSTLFRPAASQTSSQGMANAPDINATTIPQPPNGGTPFMMSQTKQRNTWFWVSTILALGLGFALYTLFQKHDELERLERERDKLQADNLILASDNADRAEQIIGKEAEVTDLSGQVERLEVELAETKKQARDALPSNLLRRYDTADAALVKAKGELESLEATIRSIKAPLEHLSNDLRNGHPSAVERP